MSPIKKIVIGLAAITVALSLITANNMASVMLIVASREAGSAAQQSVQTNAPAHNQTNNNSQSSPSNDSTASNNAVTNNTETTAPAADNNAANNSSNNTAADDKTPADNNSANADSGKKLADKEVVDLYKKAVNAARTKSTSVVRVKDGAINYKGIVEAGALSSVASSLMGAFMAADEAAIEAKNEPWEKEKLPDASALTTNGLQKISYEEKDGKYVVTLVAKNAKNPKAGADGIGSISGVIEESQITGAIGSFPLLKLQNISLDYENVTTVATIDKATGNLTELKLNAPCVLGLDAAMGPLSINGAKVGIQVITEYTVAY